MPARAEERRRLLSDTEDEDRARGPVHVLVQAEVDLPGEPGPALLALHARIVPLPSLYPGRPVHPDREPPVSHLPQHPTLAQEQTSSGIGQDHDQVGR